VPKEIAEDEKRVSLVPEILPKLAGLSVLVEDGAGEAAGFSNDSYVKMGGSIAASGEKVYQAADVILKLRPPTVGEAKMVRKGSALVSFLFPLSNLDAVRALVARGATAFAMELIPRLSRAQPMDALSSQATLAGYKAVLLAAESLPKLFPMIMSAAGVLPPAKVLVVGAGVAGLQAIATARRLGAVVEGYDIRPAAKEQVESLGAKFVELPVEAKEAQDAGGYAKAQTKEFYQSQQNLLADRVKNSDVVITTAVVPGQKAPMLISSEAVQGMRAGSVVVDLAAEQGGNCALTEPGKVVAKNGVTIHGPLNLASTMAPQASTMYARNVVSFLQAVLRDGQLKIDTADELIRAPLVIYNGEVRHEATKAALGEGT
jgi:NAD(P) transhydrogenase subunit alpha